MPIHVVEASATADDPFEVTVAEIGPMRDGLGTITWESDGSGRARWRLDLPWLPPTETSWETVDGEDATRLALVPGADGLSYDAYVDGELAFHFATFEQLGTAPARTFGVEVGPFDGSPAGVELVELGAAPCAPTG